jgi:hypothetical protein
MTERISRPDDDGHGDAATRKVIQIACSECVDDVENNPVNSTVIALCDDGTIWHYRLPTAASGVINARWIELPRVPGSV